MELTERPSFPSTRSDASAARYPRSFRHRAAGFSGRFAFHPAEPPLIPRVVLSRTPFSPRTIPRYPERTRRRSPRRRVHPGHFADERAIGDPRDTVPSSAPPKSRIGTRQDTCAHPDEICGPFTHPPHSRIRCREDDLIITSLIPRRYFRPSRNNTRFPSSRADRRPTN